MNNPQNEYLGPYLSRKRKDKTAIDLATVVEFQDKVHNLFTKELISKYLLN